MVSLLRICSGCLLISALMNAGEDMGYFAQGFTFAVIPKSIDNPFFDLARDGCIDQATILGVTCLYTGPPADVSDNDGQIQADMIRKLVSDGSVDGLAVSVKSVDTVGPALNEAVEAGLPVVTFDSDAPDSKRTAYIGTDNHFFGVQLAKVLKQLQPHGGTYATLMNEAPNIMQRVQGFKDELHNMELSDAVWVEIPGSPGDYQANLTLAMEIMHGFAEQYPTAIAPVMGAPMRSGTWKEFVDIHRNKNITLISGDAMPNQLEFMDQGYVDGLVGQLPYEMGFKSIQVLHALAQDEHSVSQEIIGTNVLTHLEIPLVLPKLEVDHNLIAQWRIVGFVLFAVCGFCACAFGFWTYQMRTDRVVKVAQPMFLIKVAVGVFVMTSAIIPLSFDDDGNEENQTDRQGALQCMSVPWLGFCGFTITFSALFSKTMRINKILRAHTSFTRIEVKASDVLVTFFVVFTANIVILTCWTIMDPLIYVRETLDGTDGWNRVIATHGSCRSDHAEWYLVPLCIVNVSVLVIANWQAYKARNIESEFSEAKYIGMTMASLLQAALSGIPILFVVRESPQAYYMVLTLMIFVIGMAVLLLIFIPKIVLADHFSRHSATEQKRLIMDSLRRQSGVRSFQEKFSVVARASTSQAANPASGSISNHNRRQSFLSSAGSEPGENGILGAPPPPIRKQRRRTSAEDPNRVPEHDLEFNGNDDGDDSSCGSFREEDLVVATSAAKQVPNGSIDLSPVIAQTSPARHVDDLELSLAGSANLVMEDPVEEMDHRKEQSLWL